MKYNVLRPTKFKVFNKNILGFDIETYDNNRKFLMASIYLNKKNNWFFEDKRKLIDFFKSYNCFDSFIATTNLGFDFFGTFYNQPEEINFDLLFRGSNLIYAKSCVKNNKFQKKRVSGSRGICFIDTMNYVPMSVNDLGKIIGIKKLKETVSKFIGQKPKTKKQFELMKTYNMRDAEISQKIIKFFFTSFNKLGANPKYTIASTAMSLYRNKYLDDNYYTHNVISLMNQFRAYYGGNTHAYYRGLIRDYNYYDFNSLYPSVMMNEYPDPNSKRVTTKGDIFYIDNYEGVSCVDIECPYMYYPYLPFRGTDKLLFAYGNFTGWYTHYELRKAVDLGYKISTIYKSIYFKKTCYPFKHYIEDLYTLRLTYQQQKSAMQIVTKLLMNSLYGKFGQKFIDRDNWVPFNHTIEELNKLKYFERIGNYLRIKQPLTHPACFCFPIWAGYVTAYARSKLYDMIKRSNAVYVDTDSVITKKKFLSSNELGKLKLERRIEQAILVKPKFYMIKDKDSIIAKIKGIGVKVSMPLFLDILTNKKVNYKKFMKFKEAVRRNMLPNEIIDMQKVLNIEDDKRFWYDKFDKDELQISQPLKVKDGIVLSRDEQLSALQHTEREVDIMKV